MGASTDILWSRLVLAQTAVTKYCRLSYLRDVVTVLKVGGVQSNQGASSLGSGESPLSGLWKAVFLQCPLVWKEEGLWPLPLLVGTLTIMVLPLRTTSKRNYFSEAPLQIQSHWRVGLQRVSLEGTQMFSP